MFPEGKIFESGKLGAEYLNERGAGDASSIRRLKWGVGKLVAHCPVRMVVLPFHHVVDGGHRAAVRANKKMNKRNKIHELTPSLPNSSVAFDAPPHPLQASSL